MSRVMSAGVAVGREGEGERERAIWSGGDPGGDTRHEQAQLPQKIKSGNNQAVTWNNVSAARNRRSNDVAMNQE